MPFFRLENLPLKNLLILCTSTSLFIGIFLGTGGTLLWNKEPNNFKEIRTPGDYTFISPLLECENVELEYSSDIMELRTLVGDLIADILKSKRATAVSYYFRDLNNGPWVGIEEDQPHSPASLIKIPLAMAYYKQAELTPEILDQEIFNSTAESADEQNIKPQVLLQADTTYTVKELIKFMLVYSSNDAFELLNNYLYDHYPDKLDNIYVDLGIKLAPNTHQNPNGNIISVREYASFFRILYNSSYLSKTYSESMLQLLSTATFNEAIVSGVPAGTTVSHKYGERFFAATKEYQLHDCGVVYAVHKPYLLCVMTRGTDLNELSSIIRDISATTYTSFIVKK